MTSTGNTSSPSNPAEQSSGAPSVVTSAPPPRARPSSYASATKGKPQGAPAIASSTPPAIVGGSVHHGKLTADHPANGKPAATLPSGGPPIVSSAPVPNGSGANPASVTISAQRNSAFMANGGASAPARHEIAFGSMNPSGSPATASSVPHMPRGQNLGAPAGAPAQPRSPSPIPPPTVSGGRPPSGPQGQGTQVSFGSLPGAEGSDPSLMASMPQGAANLPAQHYRRDSSHSAQGDMSGAMNRPFVPGNNRNRNFNNSFTPNMQPANPAYRPNPGMQPRNNVPVYQPQPQLRAASNSPYQANRSPAMAAAAMHPQPHMGNGPPMPYGAYPHHMNPQQNPGIYGMAAPGYMPYQQEYYPPQYMQPVGGIQYGGQPASPRPFPTQHTPPQPFMPGQYNPPAGTMARQASGQGPPDRPGSATSQAHAPSLPPTQGTPPASSSPGPRPERKSKAIVIKKPDGEVVDLKKSIAQTQAAVQRGPPAVVPSTGPSVPSSSSTPPRTGSNTPQHARSASVQQPADKVAEESRRNKFVEQFNQQLKIQGVKPQEDEKPAADKAASQTETKTVDGSGASEAKAEAEARKATPEPTKQPEPAKETSKLAEAVATKEPERESMDTPEDKPSEEEDDEERWIRELEEAERLEEEREREYTERKKKEAEAKKLAEAGPTDEELKRAEREAEEREEAKLRGLSTEESAEAKAERERMFSALARPSIGPVSAEASGQSTPAESAAMPPPPIPAAPSSSKTATAARSKPTMLKLETNKSVEPAQPTAGMQSLRDARFLELKNEEVNYPAGIRSPNPALNQGTRTQGRQYDKEFLLQFQDVFKEKPNVNWDKTLKETLGEPDSARPQSARPASMGGRQPSRGPTAMHTMSMGNFSTTTRTLPPGTTSDQRFQASNQMVNPLSQFANMSKPASLGRQTIPFPMPPVGSMGAGRSGSSRGPASNSPRNGSGRNQSRQSKNSAAQEEKLAKTMPLTAGKDLKPLVVSKSGWKPTSIGSSTVQPTDHMPPDMVQRKVKAALNKMTPENFPKITDSIVAIASQSKEETDGRTLRQIIQLTFEKACDEAHWSNMYARFCQQMFQDLDGMQPPIQDDAVRDKAGNVVTGGALFRKYLLTRCQEEFERGWEVNLPERPEGETGEAALLSDEYYEAAAAKRKGLGLVQFIGELYKLGMLNIRIMHECVHKLLDFKGMPDESSVESLVKLLRTVGQTMEQESRGLEMVKVYFDRMQSAMNTEGLPSRTYYMLLDMIDLRRNNWVSKDSDKGPKTIQEIRNDAARAQESARANNMRGQGGRPPLGGRDGGRQYSGGAPPPPDYKNQVGIDDLRKLARNARSNQSFAATSLGPSNMLGSRSNSGRKVLGPMSKDDSGPSSRTGTPPVKDKETRNAFELLANDDDAPNDAVSPPSTQHNSPALAKSSMAARTEETKTS